MKFSFVIASRNDGFCGDPMARLRLSLLQLLKLGSDFEVVVTDWGSEEPIAQVMRDLPQTGQIRFLHVAADVAGKKFDEIVALNTALRRTKGKFVGRLDQDTLIGERFAHWAAQLPEDTRTSFFSLRRGLPEGVSEPRRDAPVEFPDVPLYFMGAVGILLAPRWMWGMVRGYFEGLSRKRARSAHIEHDLCIRLNMLGGLENLGAVLDYDFYHLWHPTNPAPSDNPLRGPYDLCRGIMAGEYWNSETWGLATAQSDIHETVW